MSARNSRIEGVLGPLLVRLLAAFERYARRMIEDAIAVHRDVARSYDDLTSHIRMRNTALTGTLLASIESPREHLALQFDSLISNLASCQSGSTTYHLNAQAFAAAVSGMNPSALERALANVGIREWWDELGADGGLVKVLGTRGARNTGKMARDRLEELWRWRNHLAHGGDEEVALSEHQLRDCLAFVRAFTVALDAVVFSRVRQGAA
ncbi:MAG: HEPN domain-containing protein [Burkholderiales bacterium]